MPGEALPIHRSILRIKPIKLAPILLALWLTPALADRNDDAINKAFPGFRIMGPSDIALEKGQMNAESYERVKDHPGLAVGRFDSDELQDFAALIRATKKKVDRWRNDYYDGHLVVCYGRAGGGFECMKTSPTPEEFHLPFDFYLDRVGPGRRFCLELQTFDARRKQPVRKEREIRITTKTDSIGYFRTMGSGDVIVVPRGKTRYAVCVLND